MLLEIEEVDTIVKRTSKAKKKNLVIIDRNAISSHGKLSLVAIKLQGRGLNCYLFNMIEDWFYYFSWRIEVVFHFLTVSMCSYCDYN